jgi:hypothetical protein
LSRTVAALRAWNVQQHIALMIDGELAPTEQREAEGLGWDCVEEFDDAVLAMEAEAPGASEIIVPALLAVINAHCVRTMASRISADAIDGDM